MKDTHVMNVIDTDIFEQLWSVLPFVPIVILYSRAIQYVDKFLWWLQENFEIIKQLNTFAGFGVSSIILLLVEKASASSENDFISGPIQTFNLYSFFYVGLLFGDIQFATIAVGFYLVIHKINIPFLGKTSISKKEWMKFRSLGMSRNRFVFQHYFFDTIVNFISMIVAFHFLQNHIPIQEWISSGFISQIKFLTLQIILWKSLYEISYAIYFWKIPLRKHPEVGYWLGFTDFLVVGIPPALFFWTVNKITITIYIIAYIYAWSMLGRFLATRIDEGGNMNISDNIKGYQ